MTSALNPNDPDSRQSDINWTRPDQTGYVFQIRARRARIGLSGLTADWEPSTGVIVNRHCTKALHCTACTHLVCLARTLSRLLLLVRSMHVRGCFTLPRQSYLSVCLSFLDWFTYLLTYWLTADWLTGWFTDCAAAACTLYGCTLCMYVCMTHNTGLRTLYTYNPPVDAPFSIQKINQYTVLG